MLVHPEDLAHFVLYPRLLASYKGGKLRNEFQCRPILYLEKAKEKEKENARKEAKKSKKAKKALRLDPTNSVEIGIVPSDHVPKLTGRS